MFFRKRKTMSFVDIVLILLYHDKLISYYILQIFNWSLPQKSELQNLNLSNDRPCWCDHERVSLMSASISFLLAK